MTFTKKPLTLAVSAALGMGSMSLAVTGQAQEQIGAPAAVEEIVVTGSRIARADFVSNSPVATVDAEQFELTGTVNTETLLNSMPQTVPGFDSSSNNPGEGIATVNLRGLGTSRTLVLMDGIRMTPSNFSGVVDLNSIPPAMIERVEVVTGGASAVYGSDAIAGVVNFIMKRDFEGIDISAGHRISSRGDGEITNLNLTMGGNFDGGRGNAVVSMGYTDRKELFAGERGFGQVALRDNAARDGFNPGGSSAIPATLDNSLGLKFDGNGATSPYTGADAYNYSPVNFLQIPQERLQLSGFGRYELADNLELYARGTFTNSRTDRELAATPFFQPLSVTVDGNPFFNEATQQAYRDFVLDSFDPETGEYMNGVVDPNTGAVIQADTQLFGRTTDLGPRALRDSRNTYQFVFGATGDIAGSWGYDVYWSEGRYENKRSLEGTIDLPRLRQGLLLDTSDPDNVTCRDTSDGCIPLNIYGDPSLTPEMVEFLARRENTNTDITQRVIAMNVAGDTGDFQLPGGPIGLAGGYEFIFQRGDFNPSQGVATGDASGLNPQPPVFGQFNAKSIYAEAYLPILSGAPFAEILALELAYRTTDYETVGTVDAYKLAGEWAPIQDVRFRASFNTAVRAPNIGDLFSPQARGANSAQDPCSEVAFDQGIDDVEARRELCIATGVPAQNVFSPIVNAAAGQVGGITGGNPDLQEEEAETFTFGVVVQPQALPGLTVSVDYFNIQIDERIATFGGGVSNVLDTCYNDPEAGGVGSPFCDAIVRFSNGFIDFVEVNSQNIASSKLEGVDVAIEYGWETNIGTFDVNYLGTYTRENSFVAFPGASVTECADRFGNNCRSLTGTVDPEYRHRATVRWGNGSNLTAQLVWNHIGSATDDANDPSAFTVTRISAKNYFDTSLTWTGFDNYRATIGINNVLDRSPPLLGGNAEQTNTYPSVYDPYGRMFFVNVGARF